MGSLKSGSIMSPWITKKIRCLEVEGGRIRARVQVRSCERTEHPTVALHFTSLLPHLSLEEGKNRAAPALASPSPSPQATREIAGNPAPALQIPLPLLLKVSFLLLPAISHPPHPVSPFRSVQFWGFGGFWTGAPRHPVRGRRSMHLSFGVGSSVWPLSGRFLDLIRPKSSGFLRSDVRN